MSCCESESSAAAEPKGSLPPETAEEDLACKPRGNNRNRVCTIHWRPGLRRECYDCYEQANTLTLLLKHVEEVCIAPPHT